MKNDFLAMNKNFIQLTSHFLSFSQANMNFLASDKIFDFVSDKNNFVRAEGRGNSIFLESPKWYCDLENF